MQNIKFTLLVIIILALTGFLAYWALLTIEPGNVHADRQRQEDLEQKNEELLDNIEELKDEIASLRAEQEEKSLEKASTVEPAETPTTSTKYQSLINDLQKLIDDKIYMKEKSHGTRVGTIQTFLNIYNGTSKKVDNDYGAGTKTDVMKFQKAVGLTADGEAGPSTFAKMIEWLKTH